MILDFLIENEVSGDRDATHDIVLRQLGDRSQRRARAHGLLTWCVQVRAELPVLTRASLAVAVSTRDCAHVKQDIVDEAAHLARCSDYARARALPHREERALDLGLVGRFLLNDLIEGWLSRATLPLGIPIERSAVADCRAARADLQGVGLCEFVTTT